MIGVVLLILSWLLDGVGFVVRLLIVAAVVEEVTGNRLLAVALGTLAAWWPGLAAFSALAGVPGGAGLTRLELRARSPSHREQGIVDRTLAELLRPGMRGPSLWYVIDVPRAGAYVVGTTLYIERGLIWSSGFPALLAHALRHLHSLDGRLVLASRRLVFPGMLWVMAKVAANAASGARRVEYGRMMLVLLLALVAGGLGLFLLSPGWAWYWRRREYVADAYAAELGYGQTLAAVLAQQVIEDYTLLLLWGRMSPPSERRVDRLLGVREGADRS
ncbi:hypothetical protein SE17_00785 [Kouleothrix aurantiaca]|uniref:Peptidase M48 domain-containing protein n=1 Tax=Kouleothrix aurantiaca TaxID=186479 RepID=A0A0N8PT96_9CHLR|nr:hypothetical protein SE17_00785 [Kouleothrix aurantiaca]